MAGSVAHPVVPLSSTDTRQPEPQRFGRERVGRVRPGFHRAVLEELRAAYSADDRPWIVGFSGGKDSTCLAQLLYYMLARLPVTKRFKPVYVLASDTRVEVPSIAFRIRRELERMGAAADRDRLPLTTHLVFPKLNDTFWVNLIGRGYPSPNTRFRWCTDRLKIHPASEFIRTLVDRTGAVVVVLGARKDESDTRAQTMKASATPTQRPSPTACGFAGPSSTPTIRFSNFSLFNSLPESGRLYFVPRQRKADTATTLAEA